MKITAYKVMENPPQLVKANPKREWMDNTLGKFAYRCLPLIIANSYGWEVKSNCEFIATYTGGNKTNNISVDVISGDNAPVSHFGDSILSWRLGYIFKTEYPYGLYVQGPVNQGYSNIIPLTGIVETYWLPFTFTMNWQFIDKGTLYMKPGDTICHIFPVDLRIFETIETETLNIEDYPEIKEDYNFWKNSRNEYNRNPNRKIEEWQKFYFKGQYPNKVEKVENHITKINVPDFTEK